MARRELGRLGWGAFRYGRFLEEGGPRNFGVGERVGRGREGWLLRLLKLWASKGPRTQIMGL